VKKDGLFGVWDCDAVLGLVCTVLSFINRAFLLYW
jgi:hypothetical protein